MTDREIDVLVAEKVMGWKQVYWIGSSYRETYCKHVDASGKEVAGSIWPPSTNPAACQMVKDKISEYGYYWRIERTPSGKITVAIWGNGNVTTVRGDNEFRAICLAALRAKGVEIDGN